MKLRQSCARALRRAAAALCGAAISLAVIPHTLLHSHAAGQKAASVVSPDIGLVGNLFSISGSDAADHAQLQWATTLKADNYTLYRSTTPEDGFEPVYSGRRNVLG